jgi:ComF family protein
MCPDCEKTLPYTSGADIKQKIPFAASAVAPLYYEKNVRQSLLRYKFGGCPGYADTYAALLADCVGENLQGEYDLVSWVPLSTRRLRSRGYDQARLLAEKTARILGADCTRLLKKTRNTRAQSATGSAEKRRANIAGAYVVTEPDLVNGKNILLFDDIITTGSTLSECARMLGMAGAGKVSAAAVARHRD